MTFYEQLKAGAFSGGAPSPKPKGLFTCDEGYYFDSQVTCNLAGTTRQKSNDIPAIGIIVSFLGGAYCNPIFISPEENGCYYNVNQEAAGTVEYDGLTWYFSKQENGVSGNYSDSEGHMLSYPTECAWDDSIRSISKQSVLDILAYVHAAAT